MNAPRYTEPSGGLVAGEPALVTAEQLAADHPPHSCELIAGRVVAVSPAGMRHTFVVGRITR